MNRLKSDKQAAVISALVEGVSVRSTERMTGVHRDTIIRLMVQVGETCSEINVGQAIKAAAKQGASLSFIFTPSLPYISHSTIKGLPDPETDQDKSLEVAAAIKWLVRREDIHPAIV